MKIRLVASDLDGTLLNSKGELSEENAEAIRALYEMGIYFVPATGRTYSELVPAIANNPCIRYYVLSSGAAVYDKKADISSSISLPADTVRRAFRVFERYEYFGVAHCGKSAVMSVRELKKSPLVYGYLRELFLEVAEDVDNFRENLEARCDVDMLCAVFESAEVLDAVIAEIKAIGGVEVCTGTLGRGVYNIEICAKGADKGGAVARLADMLGIDSGEVAVIGDSANDYSMISRFENSFAVENARSLIKDTANYSLCSNNDHAIKYLLESFIKP